MIMYSNVKKTTVVTTAVTTVTTYYIVITYKYRVSDAGLFLTPKTFSHIQ